MASNVSESCKIWNCKIDTEIVVDMGDLEHAREFLSQKNVQSEYLEENTLYWVTDKTPHELTDDFFVLSRRMYRFDHPTPNPN